MRRKIVIALLATGTVLGYGSGIAHAVHMHRAHCCEGASRTGNGPVGNDQVGNGQDDGRSRSRTSW
jgi:hypothetical protein